MLLPHLLRILHLTGFGLLVTATLGGWILFRRYLQLDDYRSQAALLKGARSIGLLSPLAILVMLVTGIGQIHFYGYGLFAQTWLTLKLSFFLIAATAGVLFSIRSSKRGQLIDQLAEGTAAPEAEKIVRRLDSQQRVFYFVQSTLLLLILLLSVIKPGH
jgi:hypothetical protein